MVASKLPYDKFEGLTAMATSMAELGPSLEKLNSGLQALRNANNEITRAYSNAAPKAESYVTDEKVARFAEAQMLSTEAARKLLRLAYMDDLGFGWMENPYAYWDGTWKEEYV